MKYIKKLLLVLVLLFAFVLVGCGGSENPDKPSKGDRNIEQVKTSVVTTLEEYGYAEHGSFVLTNKVGNETSKVEMVFNYAGDEVLSQKTILTDSKGELSCYIDEESAYVNQYNESKRIIDVDVTEGIDLIAKYSFNGFCAYPVLLLNNSFFDSASIASQTATSVKVDLNIGAFDITNEEESDALTNLFDKIKEANAVSVEVFFNEVKEGQKDVVNRVLITIDSNDKIGTIDLELKGTSFDEIAIEFPDFSDYER